MTKRTLSEIAATCQKAARGTGCPWGLAEEAGMAARLLSSHGLPGAATIAAILTTPRSCTCTGAVSGPRCGLEAMAALSDRIASITTDRAYHTGAVTGPMVVVAALLAAKSDGPGYRLSWPGAALCVTSEGVSVELCPDAWPVQADDMTVSVLEGSGDVADPAYQPSAQARSVDQATWQVLEDLAARTYVPESEASRASGAGADQGVSD